VLRVVEIHAAGKVLVLVTSRQDLPAEIIGLIYRYRWQIELFFKWFKTILGCRHWLAESPRGVALQLYSALIATLLLMMQTGPAAQQTPHGSHSALFYGLCHPSRTAARTGFAKKLGRWPWERSHRTPPRA